MAYYNYFFDDIADMKGNHPGSNGVSTFILPAGWYFAVRQTAGSGLTIVSAFDQTLGI